MSTERLGDDHVLRCRHLDVGIAALDELHLRVRHSVSTTIASSVIRLRSVPGANTFS